MPADPFAGLLGELSKGQRAAYPYLRSLALMEPPLSANTILDTLKQFGFGTNRQAGLDLVALVRDKADLSQFIRTFGESAIIPGSLHKVGVSEFAGGNKFQYLVGTNSDNPLIPEAIYINSPTSLSAEQIYGRAAGVFTYEQGSGMAAGDLGDVAFSIDDARFTPGEALAA